MQWLIGLNSLRFFAIVLIVIYHLFRSFLPGGFIAVEIFFTISGFLIIGKLIREAARGKIHYGKFIRDRLLKIYPALLISMIVVLALAFFVHPDVLAGGQKNTLAALSFSTNFVDLLTGGTYENTYSPNIFEHTWFLALEMQLYLALPFIFMLVTKLHKKHRTSIRSFGIILAVLAATSIGLMILYGAIFGLHDRAYFMPDSHIFGFCLGGLYAVINYFMPRPPRTPKAIPAIGLLMSIVIITILSFKLSFDSSLTFIFGLPFTALLTVIMIVCVILLQPNIKTRHKTLNAIRLLEYLGSLSFGIYLFHWPLYILMPHIIGVAEPGVYTSITIVSSILLAMFSDMFIRGLRLFRYRSYFARFATVAVPAAMLVLAVLAVVRAPQTSSISQQLQSVADSTEAETETESEAISYLDLGDVADQTRKILDTQLNLATDSKNLAPSNVSYAAPSVKKAKVLVIGDSVTLGAKYALESTITGTYVDAKESRGIETATGILSSYAAKGKLPDIIVISLATNQRNITDSILSNIINVGGWNRTYILVTAYAGPQQPRDAQNAALKSFANKHKNVYIADWWSIAHNDWSLMYADHIHLNPEGRKTYANLIYSSIRSAKR